MLQYNTRSESFRVIDILLENVLIAKALPYLPWETPPFETGS